MAIVSDLRSIGVMTVDSETSIFYFSDPEKGTIESYDPDSGKRLLLYSGLNKPRSLSVSNGLVTTSLFIYDWQLFLHGAISKDV